MAMRGGEKGQQLKTIKDNYGGSQIKQMKQSHAGGEKRGQQLKTIKDNFGGSQMKQISIHYPSIIGIVHQKINFYLKMHSLSIKK